MSLQHKTQQCSAKSLSNMGCSKDFKSLASTDFAIRAARLTHESSARQTTWFHAVPRAICNKFCNSEFSGFFGSFLSSALATAGTAHEWESEVRA